MPRGHGPLAGHRVPQQRAADDDAQLRQLRARADQAALHDTKINQVAKDVGLTTTRLESRIGCNSWGAGKRNHTTAAELAKIWADVERGTTRSNEFRQAFFDRVKRFSQDPVFRNMVEAEGIAMGVSAAEREQLWLGIRQLSRGGDYNIWTGTRTNHTDTAAGILRIPFQRPGGHVGTRSYAWSLLQVESLLDAGAGWNNASKEMFRIPIRQALASSRAN